MLLGSYYFSKIDGIAVTLPAESRSHPRSDLNQMYREALLRVNVVIWFSAVCLTVELCCLLSAHSLGWPRATLFCGLAHALGAFFLALAQMDGWSFVAMEYNFALFALAPALVEVVVTAIDGSRLWLERSAPTHAPVASGDSRNVILGAKVTRLIAAISAGLLLAAGVPLLGVYADKARLQDTLFNGLGWLGVVMMILGLAAAGLSIAVDCYYLKPRRDSQIRRDAEKLPSR